MSKYSEYEYRKQPGFDMNTFEGAYQAIPMKTLVLRRHRKITATFLALGPDGWNSSTRGGTRRQRD
jgi:hypothetical protein